MVDPKWGATWRWRKVVRSKLEDDVISPVTRLQKVSLEVALPSHHSVGHGGVVAKGRNVGQRIPMERLGWLQWSHQCR